MLRNKTATESWNTNETEGIIDKFVLLKEQGKPCEKKLLKIAYKQTMWRVYRRPRKNYEYTNYKEALNAATTEIRQSKRSYEQ